MTAPIEMAPAAVAADRGTGARGPYVLSRELLPNVVGPILVYPSSSPSWRSTCSAMGCAMRMTREAINK